MSVKKTAWHPPFTDMLRQRRPRWITVTGEVQLSTEPLRVDDLLEVWTQGAPDPTDLGSTLRGLWLSIRRVGLLEYKSVVWPFHHGDLFRLLSYGYLWLAQHQGREKKPDGSRGARLTPEEVTLILAVPSLNKALGDELASLNLTLPASTSGYYTVPGALLPLVVVDLTTVAEQEGDDLLRWFAGSRLQTLASQRWVRQHFGTETDPMNTQATPDLEGYEEFAQKLLAGIPAELRLAGLAPEERLAGIPAEQRLAGLTPEERLLALPPEVLALLPESFLASQPPEVQATLRARRKG
jgi:hypothetical protein